MTWDDDKSAAADPDNPTPDEQLTADEWDAHVNEGHWPSNELNLSINGSGDPVITDPQNADQEVLRYDRSAGEWVFSQLSVASADISSLIATLDANGNTISNLPAPSSDGDAARKQYVDALEQGLDVKASVVAATDGSNIDLASATDPNPIDGVTLSDGERVILKDQTDATENGIYEATTATDPTTWVRASDADTDVEVTSGLFSFVEEGTTNANRGFVITTTDPITVGSTAINWVQFSGAGQITAGSNLTKTGDTLALASALVGLTSVDTDSIENGGSRVAFPDGFAIEGVKARLSGPQTGLPSGADTSVEFDTTDYDTGSNFDTGNFEYNVPTNGEYFISTNVAWAAQITDGTTIQALIDVNGSEVAKHETKVGAGGSSSVSATTIEQLSNGDTISVDTFQNSGVNADLLAGESRTRLTIARIG